MSFNFDVTNPIDNAIISQFPANERAARTAMRDSIDVEHDAEGGGRHKIPVGNDAARAAITDWVAGSIYINTESGDGALEFAESIDPDVFKPLSGIPSGTKMVFVQNAAPVGWTFDATLNDRVLRVTSTEANGGATGGNWTLSGMAVDGHSITVAEMAAHTHNGDVHNHSMAHTHAISKLGGSGDLGAGSVSSATPGPSQSGPSSAANTGNGGGGITSSVGSGNAHTHGLTNTSWRPEYVDVIICAKN